MFRVNTPGLELWIGSSRTHSSRTPFLVTSRWGMFVEASCTKNSGQRHCPGSVGAGPFWSLKKV